MFHSSMKRIHSRKMLLMQQVTGMHRKSLTRLIHAQSLERKPRVQPRGRRYGPEMETSPIEEQLTAISRAWTPQNRLQPSR